MTTIRISRRPRPAVVEPAERDDAPERVRLALLVVPPDARAAVAHQVFSAATTVGNDRPASALLADASATGRSAVLPGR